jgi:hypothetical protein
MVQSRSTGTTSLQVGFVGDVGRKLYIQRDADSPIYRAGATTNIDQHRPYLPDTFGDQCVIHRARNATTDFRAGAGLAQSGVSTLVERRDDPFERRLPALMKAPCPSSR